MAVGQVGMQRRVDAGRARIEVEGTVGQVAHHLVLVLDPAIEPFQPLEPGEIERREAVELHRAEITARALDPEHGDRLARQRILGLQLGRGVAAAIVGDALVRTQQVRAVEQPSRLVEAGGVVIVPSVRQRCRSGHTRALLGFGPRIRLGRPSRQTEPPALTGRRRAG